MLFSVSEMIAVAIFAIAVVVSFLQAINTATDNKKEIIFIWCAPIMFLLNIRPEWIFRL